MGLCRGAMESVGMKQAKGAFELDVGKWEKYIAYDNKLSECLKGPTDATSTILNSANWHIGSPRSKRGYVSCRHAAQCNGLNDINLSHLSFSRNSCSFSFV